MRVSRNVPIPRRNLINIALILSAILSDVPVSEAEPITIYGLVFPDRIAGATRGDVKDFERSSPGLGWGVKYLLPEWMIDIYVYDLQQRSIPEGSDSAVVMSQLGKAKGDIIELEKQGTYRNVSLKGDYTIRDAHDRPRLACAAFTYTRQQTVNVDSFLCLTGWGGKFIKFRMTTPAHNTSAEESRRFLGDCVQVLWPER